MNIRELIALLKTMDKLDTVVSFTLVYEDTHRLLPIRRKLTLNAEKGEG